MQTSAVFYRGELKRIYPVMERGEGVYLYDAEGKKYLDAMSGIAVVNLGYGVQEIVDAIAEQARQLPFCFTIRFTSEPQEELAKKIANISPPGLNRVWFSLSGAEANECAIKVARQFHVETGNPSKFKVISRWQSYHGSSLALLSLSGFRKAVPHHREARSRIVAMCSQFQGFPSRPFCKAPSQR